MTTILAITAAVTTFLAAQFAGIFVLAIAAANVHFFRVLTSLEPWKSIVRLALWVACGWLGVNAYTAIA